MKVDVDYQPLPSQMEFHAAPEKIRLFSGGVGSGKTTAGAIEALKLAVQNPGCEGMIISPTWSMLSRVSLKKFLEICPKSLIKSHAKMDRRLELVNGSSILYGSSDRPYTLEGVSIAWFWADEVRFFAREAYDVLLARLRAPKARRLGGILTSTPAMTWLFDEFHNQIPDRGLITASTRENRHLPASYITDLEASYSDSLFASYVDGQFVQVGGAVFPQFNLKTHVQDLPVVAGLPVHMGIDFGYRKPAVIFFQHFPACAEHQAEDCIHVVDEMHIDNISTVQLSKKILHHYHMKSWIKGLAYVDPAGKAKSVTVGWSDVDILTGDGFNVEYTTDPMDRNIPHGIELIRSKLKNVRGQTSLFFDSALESQTRGIIRALKMSEYPKIKRNGEVSDTPTKDGKIDHARDALRYALINVLIRQEAKTW